MHKIILLYSESVALNVSIQRGWYWLHNQKVVYHSFFEEGTVQVKSNCINHGIMPSYYVQAQIFTQFQSFRRLCNVHNDLMNSPFLGIHTSMH